MFYLGDGLGPDKLGKKLPLYLDGSGDIGYNTKCCVGLMVPPLPKDAVPDVGRDVGDAAGEEPQLKKAKVTKPKPCVTHEIAVTNRQITTSTGQKFFYALPAIVDVESNDFDEQVYTSVNKGQLYRRRTWLDDYTFPAPNKGATKVSGKGSFVSIV